MPAGLKARGDDQVYPGRVQRFGLCQRGGGAHGPDTETAAFLQDLLRGDTKNKTEHRRARFQQRFDLIVEAVVETVRRSRFRARPCWRPWPPARQSTNRRRTGPE